MVGPLLGDLKRRVELVLEEESLEMCKGLVLGFTVSITTEVASSCSGLRSSPSRQQPMPWKVGAMGSCVDNPGTTRCFRTLRISSCQIGKT